MCLCTGLRGELYRGACCDNNEQDHETRTALTAADLVLSYNAPCTFSPVRHTEPPTRRRPPPLHAYLCSLPPGGTHPAHARAGRRHRARRGNGQISSAARPHVPFTITPTTSHAHTEHRIPVSGRPCDPHCLCMRLGSVLQHKHGSGRAHGRCVLISVCCHARPQPGRTAPHGHHSHSI